MEYSVYYNSYNSILIVNVKGDIRQLFTPFRVVCTVNEYGLTIGTSVYIEEVMTSNTDDILYMTAMGIFPHSFFKIVASF